MAAAERLAKRHGMTIEEAAAGGMQAPRPEYDRQSPNVAQERELAHVVHLMDYQIQLDKARIAEATERAVERGLNLEPHPTKTPPKPIRNWQTTRSQRRMNPHRHAHVLLTETSMPIEEIASLTGLDVYKIAGMKLKLRQEGKGRKTG